MKDILRLGAYLRPYRVRITLAVVASFLASVTMLGFIALVRPIAQETLGDAAPGNSPGTARDSKERSPNPRSTGPQAVMMYPSWMHCWITARISRHPVR